MILFLQYRSIKLTIKIDITDDGIHAFWRAGYGFVLEPVEMSFFVMII